MVEICFFFCPYMVKKPPKLFTSCSLALDGVWIRVLSSANSRLYGVPRLYWLMIPSSADAKMASLEWSGRLGGMGAPKHWRPRSVFPNLYGFMYQQGAGGERGWFCVSGMDVCTRPPLAQIELQASLPLTQVELQKCMRSCTSAAARFWMGHSPVLGRSLRSFSLKLASVIWLQAPSLPALWTSILIGSNRFKSVPRPVFLNFKIDFRSQN